MCYIQVSLSSLIPKTETDCRKIEYAFRSATQIFGPAIIESLVSDLKEKYNIRIGTFPCSSVNEIEAALAEIIGTSADILVSRMRSFMR